ncbi:MAG: Fic family protein [Actinobacteria bacterium]|nr:Fic family protein [Actinomycetota bacterium]
MYLEKAPSIRALTEALSAADLLTEVTAARPPHGERDRYLHWDKLRQLEPPEGLTSEQWWLRAKLARMSDFRQLPLTVPAGGPFVYSVPDAVLRHLHYIDQHVAGEVALDEVVTSERGARQRYLVNSLMEEAIRSSQLEGAMTSRVVAKELLRSGRAPLDRGEQMVVNNYRALEFMREEIGARLTPAKILELHRILAEGTLPDGAEAGRMQRPGEPRVRVFDRDDGEPIHVPPPAELLPERMQALCDFANEGEDEERFVHPVLRAILVHFWLAYDHPFVDGNGRTARILFFWLMRQRGYWLAEYLPISRLLRRAPAQYVRAFLETETDGGDTTYFLLHQLRTIGRAVEDLHLYLRRKMAEARDVEELLRGDETLNGRQAALLSHALKHPEHAYTFAGHARSNRVTHETARADLGALARRGLLARRRRGRAYVFEASADLPQRLKESGR